MMRFIYLILSLLFFAFGTYTLINAKTFQLFGDIVARVETEKPIIALTFDDGPAPKFLDETLGTLKDKNVTATFFLNGEAIEKHPEATLAIASHGHEIANHGHRHKRMILMPMSEVAEEIEATDRAINNLGLTSPPIFRPPFGDKLYNLPRYLEQTDRTTIMWDIAPEQWDGPIEDRIARVTEETQPGSILLLHVMFKHGEGSRQMLGPMIDALHAKGFAFVTVSELLTHHPAQQLAQ